MKKVLYFILLAAELFVDGLFMMALPNSSLYIPIVGCTKTHHDLLSHIFLLVPHHAQAWPITEYARRSEAPPFYRRSRNTPMRPFAVFMITPISWMASRA